MKILFIRPNQIGSHSIHIGISLLQACLKRNGHQVSIFDTTFLSENVEKKVKQVEKLGFFIPTNMEKYIKYKKCDINTELKKELDKVKPDIIAFSIMSNDVELATKIGRYIKEYDENIPILVGGVHPTVDPEGTINLDFVDMICIGEGEDACVELLYKMERGSSINDIKNIWVKQIYKNDVRNFVDLNENPPPDCSGFDHMHLYRPFWGKVYRILEVECSRGCMFNCYECINNHMKRLYKNCGVYHREKNVDKAIYDLKCLVELVQPDMFRFSDEILFPNLENLKQFAIRYKSEIDLPFIAYGHPKVLTEERAKIFKEMGCVSLGIGIEAGDEKARAKYLNRKHSNEQIKECFRICKKYNIKTTAYNLIGLPNETRSSLFKTIDLNKEVEPSTVDVSFVYPFKGTELRKYCLKNGLIDEDAPLVDYSKDTIIRNTKLNKKRLKQFHKVFSLYLHAPKFLYPVVKFCGFENFLSNHIFRWLIKYYRNKMLNKLKQEGINRYA